MATPDARRPRPDTMILDVNVFLGSYPFRRLSGTAPEAVLAAMDRASIDQAWVSHLPSLFWRDPMEGNPWLYETAKRIPRFRPVPAIHPGLPGWEKAVGLAKESAAPAVRCDPGYYGLAPHGEELRVLAAACGRLGLPLMLAVRLEDGRQRHPNDNAPELAPSSIRQLRRSDRKVRILVTHADRGFIEEVHFGSTPEEAGRIWWDICWVWGPPEDHLETLIGTIGIQRFVFGSGTPLRIPENSVAKLDLLNLTSDRRSAVEWGNVTHGILEDGGR